LLITKPNFAQILMYFWCLREKDVEDHPMCNFIANKACLIGFSISLSSYFIPILKLLNAENSLVALLALILRKN